MSIHSSKKHGDGEDDRGCKSIHIAFTLRAHSFADFYNYFDHGIDFLISDSTHIVKKIVLHTNVVSVVALVTQLITNCHLESLALRCSNDTRDALGRSKALQRMTRTVRITAISQKATTYKTGIDTPPRKRFYDRVRTCSL